MHARYSTKSLACHLEDKHSLHRRAEEGEGRRCRISLVMLRCRINNNKRRTKEQVVPLWWADTALDRCLSRTEGGRRILQALSHHWCPITRLEKYTGYIYITVSYFKKWKEFKGRKDPSWGFSKESMGELFSHKKSISRGSYRLISPSCVSFTWGLLPEAGERTNISHHPLIAESSWVQRVHQSEYTQKWKLRNTLSILWLNWNPRKRWTEENQKCD